MSDVIITVGEEETAPVVIITPGETVLPPATIMVESQEEVPVVHVTVDENSAQAAADSAAEAEASADAAAAAAAAALNSKTDKGGYTGTSQDLKNELDAINIPDGITKTGTITTNTGFAVIPADDFNWRINQVEYTETPAYTSPLAIPAATANHYRRDYITGDNTGNYTYHSGTESLSYPPPPSPATGTVLIGEIIVFGADIDSYVPPVASPIPNLNQVTTISGESFNPISVLEYGVGGATLYKNIFSIWRYIGGISKYINIKWNDLETTYDIRFPAKANGSVQTFAMVSDVDELEANVYTKSEIDSKISSVYKYKGNVPDYASLPSTGLTSGDVYNAVDTDINWAWTGTVWDNIGGSFDVSGKEDTANKSTSIITDYLSNIKFPTVKAVFDWVVSLLTAKRDISNQIEVSGNQTADVSWNGKEVTFLTSGLLTIPATLPDSFNFDLATDAGATVTWAITTPKTWLYGAPPTMTEKQICTVSQRTNTNSIRVRGL